MTGESPTERFRLFVAIPVPDPIRDEMLAIQRELQSLAPHGAVRWSKPEQFHLTLRFLGGVLSDRVAGLQESVRTVCADVPALGLRAQGIGFFPHIRSPRVIWAGVNDDENRLVELQKKIENAVQPFTVEKAGERFAGHVTLGRFKQSNRLVINGLTAKLEVLKDRRLGEWKAREIEIIQSELLATGPRYSALAVIRLGTKIAP